MSAGSTLATTELTIALSTCLVVTNTVSAHAATLDPVAAASVSVAPETAAPEASDAETTAVPIIAIVMAAIAVGGSYYGMGTAAGEKAYYAGLRNPEYQNVKWQVRAAAVGALGVIGGPVFMTGFENKFYSMI